MNVKKALVFDDESDIDMDAIEEWLDRPALDSTDDLSSSKQGRTVVITGVLETGEYET
jgi:hypothetical protein